MTSIPSVNFTPRIIFDNWLWPSRRRQFFSAASASLKIMASAVLFERHPLERTVRWRTVANELSIGLVVRRCFQCSAGKLLIGDACAGEPGGRQSRLRSDAKLPRQTAQNGHSWQPPVLSGRCVRRNRRVRLLCIETASFAMKSIGEPDAGNRHVRFDERGRETGCWPNGPKPPRPPSTLPSRIWWVRRSSSAPVKR